MQFATDLGATTRAFNGSTAIQDAIGLSYIGFGTEVGGTSNGFESTRQVIDVSGDGADNDSFSFSGAGGRDAALAAGVDAVNGLPIGGGGRWPVGVLSKQRPGWDWVLHAACRGLCQFSVRD